MLAGFKQFIANHRLFGAHDHILLAVSGGRDSVVMCELFAQARVKFGIAHCNFQLRGKESIEDEAFVEKLARHYNAPFFCKRFETTEYKEKKGGSVQMAARELRYAWFEEIREKEGYDFTATAHHLDDQIETFFINLLRSSGIAGFHGILPKHGKVIRPLLFAYRDDIEAFIMKSRLPYREDSSNLESKYLRNRIRHEVLPVLKEINPEFRKILTENIERVAEAEKIFEEAIESKRKKLIRKEKGNITISIPELKMLDPLPTYAFEFLSPFGFNYAVIRDILKVLDESAGKQFYSPTHRLIKDRRQLILTPAEKGKKKADAGERLVNADTTAIRKPVRLLFRKITRDKKFRIDPSREVANLDLSKIRFPLTLRKWKKGDFFHPFGRDQRKKLSDFFVDEKMSLLDKENAWLLCSGGKILWVVGHRIDNHFRITQRTKEVLRIEWRK